MQKLLDATHVHKGDRIAKSSLRPHERQKKKKEKRIQLFILFRDRNILF